MPSERAFIDYFANHPSTEAEFPATKPDDAGREKTMYIVLEKVDTNLDHFLRTKEAENLRNIFRMVHGTLISFSNTPRKSFLGVFKNCTNVQEFQLFPLKICSDS